MDRMLRRKLKRLAESKYLEEKQVVLDMLSKLDQFTDLSPEARAERLAACENNFWEFCRFYLGHYFTAKTQAEFHEEIVSLMQQKECIVGIAAPRGFSKSTIVSFAFILWNICFEKKRFIV